MPERWFVTGATGRLGTVLCRLATAAGIEIIASSLTGRHGSLSVDLQNRSQLNKTLSRISPDRVIHLGGVSRPAFISETSQDAHSINVLATAAIAEWCFKHGRSMVFTSTDQVFSGRDGPYSEQDEPTPTTYYGNLKRQGELAVLSIGGTVARCGWLLNDYADGEPSIVEFALQQLRQGQVFYAVDDEWRTPIYMSCAAARIIQLSLMDDIGLVHVAGPRHYRPIDLIFDEALQAGVSTDLIKPISRCLLAPIGRPGDVRLNTARLIELAGFFDPTSSLAA